ncbi:hypothetical protein EMIHUDRAFT_233133 [Emiliania huxleyi CCMP1516]|uniref:Uncharacterized protein n=2 Tax=Emiliania huxleyi TaxID=2903 RepID=A0A0D3K3F6_EMIH1|nr:hypothetical protein EMIHUDRAFT_233133 [Emiliania huxleyi CCMP1516]EOD30291.1 hypothetical protein EMIHUDRAFT_233133 [Emiliania huxleyi CCMP1516]|eukprot:XP_005782720.1 hypothetical protein EMIHUDRAFT_233133 [Emiliania huxleyi CCMP1516]
MPARASAGSTAAHRKRSHSDAGTAPRRMTKPSRKKRSCQLPPAEDPDEADAEVEVDAPDDFDAPASLSSSLSHRSTVSASRAIFCGGSRALPQTSHDLAWGASLRKVQTGQLTADMKAPRNAAAGPAALTGAD